MIGELQNLYQDFNLDSVFHLDSIYQQNILFKDPFCSVKGINALQHYFSDSLKNINYCHFHFDTPLSLGTEAYINWQMDFSHKRINKGKSILVDGTSHIKYDSKIFYHRDYYDGGALLYEHLPLMGRLIKHIKNRMRS